jgi:hypothetical protein
MNVSEAVAHRMSVRAFRPDPVPAGDGPEDTGEGMSTFLEKRLPIFEQVSGASAEVASTAEDRADLGYYEVGSPE